MLDRQVSSLLHFSLVVVLCFSIACQVIGVPVALYNLAGSQEVVESSLLESMEIVSEFAFQTPQCCHEALILSSASPSVSSVIHSIFHPPISSL